MIHSKARPVSQDFNPARTSTKPATFPAYTVFMWRKNGAGGGAMPVVERRWGWRYAGSRTVTGKASQDRQTDLGYGPTEGRRGSLGGVEGIRP